MTIGRGLSAVPDGYLAVKFGGSIISDRSQFCKIDELKMRACVQSLAQYCRTASRPPLVFLGGGSFAHPFAHQISADPNAASRRDQASLMTNALENLRSQFIAECSAAGLKATAWSEKTIFGHNGTTFFAIADAARLVTAAHEVHVMTGGCYKGKDADYEVLSSDDLAVLLSEFLPIARFAILTDVEGVIDFGSAGGRDRLVTDIPPYLAEDAIKYCRANKDSDMTGGMHRKLSNCFRLVQQGIPCYVGSAVELELDALSAIVAGTRSGTYFHAAITDAGVVYAGESC